jgi:hypothetical protein
MTISSFNTTLCINGCKIFNDNSRYLYWENRKVTNDEIDIIKFLNSNLIKEDLDILHIGIGNSLFASEIKHFNEIIGISISQNEIDKSSLMHIPNYHSIFLNKYQKNAFDIFDQKKFDLIIDINIKSFACCDNAFDNLFNQYLNLLNKNGKIITHINGLNWTKAIKPKISFSFKKFFHKKLKEIDGPIKNILSIKDCEKIAKNNNLQLSLNNKNLIIFQK